MKYLSLYGQVLTFFSARISDKEEARDLTQQVFEKIAKNSADLSRVKNLKSWIYKISQNQLIDYYRGKRLKTIDTPPDFECDSEGSELQIEMIKCQSHFIGQLDKRTEFLLIESEMKGRSQKELARELKIPYSTVRSRVQRGRAKIKAIFEENCHLTYDAAGRVSCCIDKNPKRKSC